MASKMGEIASREAMEAGALKAVRPERGREGVMAVMKEIGRRGCTIYGFNRAAQGSGRKVWIFAAAQWIFRSTGMLVSG